MRVAAFGDAGGPPRLIKGTAHFCCLGAVPITFLPRSRRRSRRQQLLQTPQSTVSNAAPGSRPRTPPPADRTSAPATLTGQIATGALEHTPTEIRRSA